MWSLWTKSITSVAVSNQVRVQDISYISTTIDVQTCKTMYVYQAPTYTKMILTIEWTISAKWMFQNPTFSIYKFNEKWTNQKQIFRGI